jgi:hypothetical protein
VPIQSWREFCGGKFQVNPICASRLGPDTFRCLEYYDRQRCAVYVQVDDKFALADVRDPIGSQNPLQIALQVLRPSKPRRAEL